MRVGLWIRGQSNSNRAVSLMGEGTVNPTKTPSQPERKGDGWAVEENGTATGTATGDVEVDVDVDGYGYGALLD